MKTIENYQLSNKKASKHNPHIYFATMYLDGKRIEIVIKKYTNNIKTLKTSIANERIICELTNERGILEILKNVSFPEGVLVPKSYLTHVDRRKKLVVPMQYIERMPGFDIAEWFDQNDSRLENHSVKQEIITKLCYGIKTLHDNNIVHRDIKPENIIIDFGKEGIILSIIDFGFAALDYNFKYKERTTFPGTWEYASPELINREPYYLKPVDIWALGVTMLALYVGNQDNLVKPINERIQRQVSFCHAAYEEGYLPFLIYNILLKIFVPQDQRITINGIIDMLNEVKLNTDLTLPVSTENNDMIID